MPITCKNVIMPFRAGSGVREVSDCVFARKGRELRIYYARVHQI